MVMASHGLKISLIPYNFNVLFHLLISILVKAMVDQNTRHKWEYTLDRMQVHPRAPCTYSFTPRNILLISFLFVFVGGSGEQGQGHDDR